MWLDWHFRGSKMIENLDPAIPANLRHFRALNGTQVKFYLLAGVVDKYECLAWGRPDGNQLPVKNGKPQKAQKKPVDHTIWISLTDGRKECLRLNKFKELHSRIKADQFLTLVIGTNGDRDDCVAIYNHETNRLFYRTEIWSKFIEGGSWLPLLLVLFVFPLIWLFLAMLFFKSGHSSKAVFHSPLIAAALCIILYFVATIPVKTLFRRHVRAIIQK
jgi:hypothetical protein